MKIRGHLPAWLILGFCVATLGLPLSRFGLWDPWELTVANQARRLLAGETLGPGPLTAARLASWGFACFGLHDWSGRILGSCAGVFTLIVTYQLSARFLGRRAGLLAAVMTAANPLFIVNALLMGGHAYAMALQAAVVFSGVQALIAPTPRRVWSWLALTAISTLLSTAALGALQGAVPALTALGAAALLERSRNREPSVSSPAPPADDPASPDSTPPPLSRTATYGIVLSAAGLLTAVAVTVYLDRAGYSLATGGEPQANQPPGFDLPIERAFHGLAPVSALLPLCLLYPLGGRDGRRPCRPRWLATLCVLWCAAAYLAQTLFLARYGAESTFLPILAVGYLVAYLLHDLERTGRALAASAITVVLMAGLLLRDFALYPSAALAGLPGAPPAVPAELNPSLGWALVLGVFAVCAALSLTARGPVVLAPKAPYQMLRAQWERGLGFRVWLVLLGAGLIGACALSLLAWTRPESLHLSHYGRLVLRPLGVGVLLLPAAVLAGQALIAFAGRLGRYRFLFLGLAACAAAWFVAYGFIPRISRELSPEASYAIFDRLAERDAELATFRLNTEVAQYYTSKVVHDFRDPYLFTQQLVGGGVRWGAMSLKDFPTLDSRFRALTKRHLFVVETTSADMVLAATSSISGHTNQNPLVDRVLSTAPESIQHPLHVVFDEGKLELLGYDLRTPTTAPLRAGDTIELTWYFRVPKRLYTDYSVFVHIDWEQGLSAAPTGTRGTTRIHGDHKPVDGLLPVHLWTAGDVIVDKHQVQLAPSAKAGQYRIWMGLFRGETRLPVTSGAADDDDRVKAGVLQIR